MRNTPGNTRRGVVAGLMIGSVLLGGGMFLAGCSAGSSSSAASSSDQAAPTAAAAGGEAASAPGLAPAPTSGSRKALGQGAGTTARLAPASSIIYTAQLT